MPNTNDQIKAGIVFEEDVVHTLAADIQEMEEFKGLPDATRQAVLTYLEKMKTDSERHRGLLLGIAEKY
jgi:hypothetical protein